MNLTALPAFADNYIWMLHDGRQALVVDPGDEAPVQMALQRLGLTLTAILVTHHHRDHIGGLEALAKGGLPVYGPLRERIAHVTHPMKEGDTLTWNGLHIEVLDVPGHTAGHIAYRIPPTPAAALPQPILFAGDTLFSAGCGRVFDGSIEQLYDSVCRLMCLSDDTLICAAHEYTLGNLRFARAVEPDNPAIAGYLSQCEAIRARGEATLPSTVGNEKGINPFTRCTVPEVVSSALSHGATDASPQAVFAALRQWKNTF